MTSAAINDRIAAVAGPGGDITAVIFQTDSGGGGAVASVLAGDASFRLLGGTGVSVTNSSTSISIASEDSEIDHDSLSNFVAAEHVDWAGASAGTIHATNYTNTTYSEATGSSEGLMSTAHHDKLDNIEAEADVTDVTNVTAAGALMDSEVTNLAQVKAFDSSDYATPDKTIYMETATFSDNLGTTTHYIPFVTTNENSNFTNVVVPMIAPVAGKLLSVNYKSNQHHHTSSNQITFALDRVPAGSNWTTASTATLGTKVIAGVNKVDMGTADFTSPTSGTNAFSAGDLVGVSITNSVNLGLTAKYVVTLVFEFDYS